MTDPPNSVQTKHASLPPMMSSPITLQVGERRFITMAETITQESHFFAALLSGRWDHNAQADGSYFIDADPGLFEHIIRYLRRGVLPIFYHNTKGHDHALYLALLGEAKYFQIPRLEKWLKEEGYLQAIKVSYSAYEVEGVHDLSDIQSTINQLEYYPTWKTKKVYICPRGVLCHRGDQDRCGRQCRSAQNDGEITYEDEKFLTTLVIRKQTVVDQTACAERQGREELD